MSATHTFTPQLFARKVFEHNVLETKCSRSQQSITNLMLTLVHAVGPLQPQVLECLAVGKLKGVEAEKNAKCTYNSMISG